MNGRPLARLLARLHRDVTGATAIEYGLLLAIFSLFLVASGGGMASRIVGVWNGLSTTVADVAS